MAEPEWPAHGAGGADAWQGPRGRVHAADREGRHVACEGFASGRPTGIVGPGNIGGTVTL